MQEGFKIDKNLPNRLDILLKEGSLDNQTEILRILQTLSEKLNALQTKEVPPITAEIDEERRKNRLHKTWGQDPFKDVEHEQY